MPEAGTRVAVIFGGPSVEHDVSIISALQLLAVLSERHRPTAVYLSRDGRFYTGEALLDVKAFGESPPVGGEPLELVLGGEGTPFQRPRTSRLRGPRELPVDVVVCAIHGTGGEDGSLLGALEHAGLPYVGGGVGPAAVAMDKALAKLAFAGAGITVNPHAIVTREGFATDPQAVVEACLADPGVPCFAKPVSLGSSIGVSRCADADQLHEALELCLELDRRALVEPALDDAIEINCAVLGRPGEPARVSLLEQPLGAGGSLSFEDKYMRGGKDGKGGGAKEAPGPGAKLAEGGGGGMAAQDRLIPAPLEDGLAARIRAIAVDAHAALGFAGVVRYDFLVDERTGEVVLNEANTVPGSFSFYLFEPAGLSFPDLADQLIDIAIAEAAEQRATTRTFESALLSRHGAT